MIQDRPLDFVAHSLGGLLVKDVRHSDVSYRKSWSSLIIPLKALDHIGFVIANPNSGAFSWPQEALYSLVLLIEGVIWFHSQKLLPSSPK
jgi:hypothetical protein